MAYDQTTADLLRENEALKAEIDNIKQVEFPRRVEKVVEGWRKKCDQLEAENAKLAKVLKASVELVCAPAWAGVSDEDCELERVLRECGYVKRNV